MKTLSLNAWERVMLIRCLPDQAPLSQIPMYVRIIETLRLKEEEQEQVGFQLNPEDGSIVIGDTTIESKVEFEDADFSAVVASANAWEHWPTSPLSRDLSAKLKEAVK